MEWGNPTRNTDGTSSQRSTEPSTYTVMWFPDKEKATGKAVAFEGSNPIATCHDIPLDQRDLQRAAIRCMRALCGQYHLARTGSKPAASPRAGG